MAKPRPIDYNAVARRVTRVLNIDWPEGRRPDLEDVIRESLLVEERKPVEYLGWHIVPMDHVHPFYDKGTWVTHGFICLEEGEHHTMPGAIWFRTVDDAKHGIDCYILAGVPRFLAENDRTIIDRFYELLRSPKKTDGAPPDIPPATADSMVANGGLSL